MFRFASQTKASNFARHPLLWLVSAFSVGILFSSFTQIYFYFPTVICFLSILTAIYFVKKWFAFVPLLVAFFSLGIICEKAEKLAVKENRLKVLIDSNQIISGSEFEVSGFLEGSIETAVGGFFLLVETEEITGKNFTKNVSGKLRVFTPLLNEIDYEKLLALKLSDGAKIQFDCKIRREEKFLNPGVASAKKILDEQGVDAICSLKNVDALKSVSNSARISGFGFVRAARQFLIDEFRKRFSISTAGVLIASLTGNRFYVDKETGETFRIGGIFHILVISGLQITFIGGAAILFLRIFTKNLLWQFVLASVFLWSYSLAVGADAPVVRAALMFTILHFSYVIYRSANLLNSLALSALILLVWQPSILFSQSFQLTFICVAALVATAFPLIEKLRAIGSWKPTFETPIPPHSSKTLKNFCEIIYWSEKNWQREQKRNVWECKIFKDTRAAKLENLRLQKILRYIFETMLVSIIVQLWLLPLSIIYFHRFSVVSIFLNVWVGLLMAIESIAALLGILIAQISEILAAPLIALTEIINWLIIGVSGFLNQFDFANLRIPHYSEEGAAIYFLYFVPLIFITVFLHKWQPLELPKKTRYQSRSNFLDFLSQHSNLILKTSIAGLFILFSLIIFHPFSEPISDGKLRLDFLDVGQGDSIFATLPTGETLLIDGGGRPEFYKQFVEREGAEPEKFEADRQQIGERVVSNFLWSKGYARVDYLIATHADTDHLQGLIAVAENFKIRNAFIGSENLQSEEFQNFSRVLERKNISQIKIFRGDVLDFGDVKIEVLHPEKNIAAKISENNKSIVLKIIFRETEILLTGDIEKEIEQELLKIADLKSDVVKVAHHGSKTSSTIEFVNSTKAKLAIASVGRDSPYGHPKSEVIERWQNAGAVFMTTGEKGTITLTSDGKKLSVETFLK